MMCSMKLYAVTMMNFLISINLFIINGLVQGVPSDKALIGDVQSNSAAEEAGLQAGDEIIQIEGDTVSTWEEFTLIVMESPSEELTMTVQRDDKLDSLTVIPAEPEDVQGEIGRASCREGG